MKTTFLIIAAICGLRGNLPAAERNEYVIRGGQESLRTEIQLKQGDCVQIKASESIKMGLVTGWNGPEGSIKKWILRKTPQFPAGALIGAVVAENGQADYFLVGTDAGLEAKTAGRLTFYINEALLGDNSGGFTIQIDREHLKSLTNKVTTFIQDLD